MCLRARKVSLVVRRGVVGSRRNGSWQIPLTLNLRLVFLSAEQPVFVLAVKTGFRTLPRCGGKNATHTSSLLRCCVSEENTEDIMAPIDFDKLHPSHSPQFLHFPSRRSTVFSTKGAVATSQPLRETVSLQAGVTTRCSSI